uniref:Uncharacterized protein n=1 Tax=Glossina pallidipes TaxID=7398 RepID=A0A1B0A9Q1_GLOPL
MDIIKVEGLDLFEFAVAREVEQDMKHSITLGSTITLKAHQTKLSAHYLVTVPFPGKKDCYVSEHALPYYEFRHVLCIQCSALVWLAFQYLLRIHFCDEEDQHVILVARFLDREYPLDELYIAKSLVFAAVLGNLHLVYGVISEGRSMR